MVFGQLMADIQVYVSCKFEMYIFEIAQVIGEHVPIAFLYVLSILISVNIVLIFIKCTTVYQDIGLPNIILKGLNELPNAMLYTVNQLDVV